MGRVGELGVWSIWTGVTRFSFDAAGGERRLLVPCSKGDLRLTALQKPDDGEDAVSPDVVPPGVGAPAATLVGIVAVVSSQCRS
jgi:hypothetical protein